MRRDILEVMANKFDFTLRGGLKMPALGLGTYAPKEGDDDVFNAVHTAVKAGYRNLDCAAIYRNERAVGSAIKKLIVEGTIQREDLFITSKLWNTCHRPDLVRASLKKSLDDLGVKYLDLYLIHWPMAYKEGEEFMPLDENGKVIFSDVDYVDTWKALEDCVDEGLVRNIGCSNFSSVQIQRILDVARIRPQANQVECHLHLQQDKLFDFCKKNNIVLIAYSPLGAPGTFGDPKTKSEEYVSCLQEPKVVELAKAKNKTPAQILLRFIIQRGLSAVPKSVKPERVVENFQIFDFELSEEEMELLRALNKDFRLNIETVAVDHKYYTFNDAF
ncbi:1,5-anhydro-D-fructose reductase-like [Mya arenaria]|uniref:1,5-anhydro-D-fructose reductase-like n=1 Tax=Mya arenaria TaxID=6604 RepID=UPI0022E0FBAD|nr:1,5-anhydro-D-fructose reductase-like [Mya arenaria]